MIVVWVILIGLAFIVSAIGIAKVIADTLDTREFNRRNAEIKTGGRLPYLWEREYWR